MLDYMPGPNQELYYVTGEERAWDAKTAPRGCTLVKCLEDSQVLALYKQFWPENKTIYSNFPL